jgi:hypothetical protein
VATEYTQVDDFTLAGETLLERRVNSEEYGGCPGERTLVYTKSTADRAQLQAPQRADVAGIWRTAYPFGLYVELVLHQVGADVTGKYRVNSQTTGTLTGSLTGTRLTGIREENNGYPPTAVELVFSADGHAFVGQFGLDNVWNGVNY